MNAAATVESATPAGMSAAATAVSTATTAVPRGRCIGRHGGKHGNACQKSECKFVLHLSHRPGRSVVPAACISARVRE